MRERALVAAVGAVALLVSPGARAAGHFVFFDPSQYLVGEGAGSVTVTVKRDGGAGSGTVEYETVDGSATAGSDYAATTGTLSFAPGETQKTFTVAITADSLDEDEETFQVQLKNPMGAITTLGQPATVTIGDDDAAPTTTAARPAPRSGAQRERDTTTTAVTRRPAPATAPTTLATTSTTTTQPTTTSATEAPTTTAVPAPAPMAPAGGNGREVEALVAADEDDVGPAGLVATLVLVAAAAGTVLTGRRRLALGRRSAPRP